MDFVKYQSLGNDCILIDRYLKSAETKDLSAECSTRLCDRHFGVGADCVLVIEKSSNNTPLMLVYNSDGSRAETCLNGLRCVADYLFCTHNFPDTFCVKTEAGDAFCSIIHESVTSHRKIRTEVGPIKYFGAKEVNTSQGSFLGHEASAGNPHFVIFQQRSPEWLQQFGHEIESHPLFPHKTNVEFVSQNIQRSIPTYTLLVYERGCGLTLSCGSGAAATVGVLAELGEIQPGHVSCMEMMGGNLLVSITQKKTIVLEASATQVFSGKTHSQ